MRRLLLAGVLSLGVLTAPPVKADVEVCEQLAVHAVTYVLARYEGFTLQQIATYIVRQPPELREYLRVIAVEAYGLPQVAGLPAQARQIKLFSDQIEYACWLTMQEDKRL